MTPIEHEMLSKFAQQRMLETFDEMRKGVLTEKEVAAMKEAAQHFLRDIRLEDGLADKLASLQAIFSDGMRGVWETVPTRATSGARLG